MWLADLMSGRQGNPPPNHSLRSRPQQKTSSLPEAFCFCPLGDVRGEQMIRPYRTRYASVTQPSDAVETVLMYLYSVPCVIL